MNNLIAFISAHPEVRDWFAVFGAVCSFCILVTLAAMILAQIGREVVALVKRNRKQIRRFFEVAYEETLYRVWKWVQWQWHIFTGKF